MANFYDELAEQAVAGWKEYQILPSLALAQGNHESRGGTSKLAKNGNNLFGIKHDPEEEGHAYFHLTWEVIDGKRVDIVEPFKWFESWNESLDGYYQVFHGSEWRKNNYADVIGETDYKEAAKALITAEASYATDPSYAEKVIEIIERDNLTEYDKEAGVEETKEKQKEETKSMVKKNGYTVGLDIGHRNHTFPNNGKGVYRGGKGYAEFDFNQKLGLRIKELLEANGFEVIMESNYASKAESLTGRTNFFNNQGVDIVISIHANAGVASASGACAFYWNTSGNGKRLAQEIINEIKAQGYGTHGNGLHASVYGSWTNLHMVRETNMPAVLVEHGFMTNSNDFQYIFGSKQDQFIGDMAQADAKGICDYFGVPFNGEVTSGSSDTLYKVQVGAYGEESNAEAQLQAIQNAGFDAFIAQEGDLYKVQVEAYGEKDNAEEQLKRVQDAGFDAFISDGSSTSGSSNKTLHLPASADTWKVYNVSGPYTTGNEIHLLTPAVYGGISYEIKGNPAPHVYLIDTGVKGRVAIYAHPSTGATIS